MKHLLRVAVVIGLLSGVWRAEADTAMVYFYDAEEPLRNGCVGAGFPPFGDPLPDGTAIYIVWDWNANGFDYSDPLPEISSAWPPPQAYIATYSSFELNGDAVGLGPGLFYTMNPWVWENDGGPDRFYMVAYVGEWLLVSDPFEVVTGFQEIVVSGWVCQPGIDGCNHMPVQGLEVPERTCDSVRIAWSGLGQGWDCRNYLISRDGETLALSPCDGPLEYWDVSVQGGELYYYAVQALVGCEAGDSGLTIPAIRVCAVGEGDAPTVENLNASDAICDSIVITWTATHIAAGDSFTVRRNGARIVSVAALDSMPSYRLAIPQSFPRRSLFTVQPWSTACGWGPVSAGDSGDVCIDAIDLRQAPLPRRTELLPAYPNPFNAAVMIPYTVVTPTRLRIAVMDVLGREVAVLYDATAEPGERRLTWTPAGGSGLYVVTLTAAGRTQMQKLLYVR